MKIDKIVIHFVPGEQDHDTEPREVVVAPTYISGVHFPREIRFINGLLDLLKQAHRDWGF